MTIEKQTLFNLFEWKRDELMVVMSVLVIIFGLSFFQVLLGGMKTRDAQRKSDVEMVSRGVRAYFDAEGVYPEMATAEGKLKSCGGMGDEVCEWGGGPPSASTSGVFINKIPRDPLGDKGYTYVYWVDDARQHFKVYVALENIWDKAFRKGLTTACGDKVQCSWYVEE